MAAWLLPLLVGAGIIILYDRQADTHTRLENISIIIEIIFPYGFLILANNLILRERENDQLVFTAVRSRLSWLYLRRFGVLLTAFVLCLS
ncbi:MAG TPA: hypothetical protein VHO48_08615, partial [Anaerolineaceae bacterium]|nr:hypothetical protein [Anaerolineaceae bacterium]